MELPVLAAYGLGLVGVIWFAIDSGRIPSMVWYWSGYSRSGWWGAMLLCFLAAGIPAFVAALAWRFGEARKVLRHEFDDARHHGRAAREARLGRSSESVA